MKLIHRRLRYLASMLHKVRSISANRPHAVLDSEFHARLAVTSFSRFHLANEPDPVAAFYAADQGGES